MSQLLPERLYYLLPELYRWRDRQQGQKLGVPDQGPLRAFLSILEQELHTLEADMEAMYDNWFIQTCDNWVVPYIADLLGIDDNIVKIDYLPFTQRRRVANTLAYRRRKGVVAILEQVLWDVTNWHIHAVEFYQLLATTQHQQHLRPSPLSTIDIRQLGLVAALDTPFTMAPRTVELRQIEPISHRSAKLTTGKTAQLTGRQTISGKYDRDNVGLYFWRLRAYPVTRGHAHSLGQNYFTFHPMGRDRQLFNQPQSFQALTQAAGPSQMPIQLNRVILAADLHEYRSTTNKNSEPQAVAPANSTYYGPDRSLYITIVARHLFDIEADIESKLAKSLNNAEATEELYQWFSTHNSALPQKTDQWSPIEITKITADQCWQIHDKIAHLTYKVVRQDTAQEQATFSVTREERTIGPAEVLSVNLHAVSAEHPTEDLAHWQRYAARQKSMLVAVDPMVGRFAFLNASPIFEGEDILVDYTYGFSSDIGGGPYPRRFQVDATWQQYCEILVAVGCTNSPIDAVTAQGAVVAANNLPYAFRLWNTYCDQVLNTGGKPRGVIRLLDNGCYTVITSENDNTELEPLWLPPTAELALMAEDGVQPTISGHNGQFIITFEQAIGPKVALLATSLSREVDTAQPEIPVIDRKLQISGVGIQGSLVLAAMHDELARQTMNAVDLIIEHCTILGGGITVNLAAAEAQALHLQLKWSITGAVQIPATAAALTITDSIIDYRLSQLKRGRALEQPSVAPTRHAIAGPPSLTDQTAVQPGPAATLERCTIYGDVLVTAPLQANTVLFTDPVIVTNSTPDVSAGYLRFSYLPAGSQTPPCERCLHEGETTEQCQHCLSHIAPPQFTSQSDEHPGYSQLSKACADEIKQGMGGIAEIGVFSHLYQPQREANIRRMLDEYLPLGLHAGIFYVS